MNINPVNSPPTAPFLHAGIEKKGESTKPSPVEDTRQADAALSKRQDLLQKLDSLPEIRPEALERGRKFLDSKNNEQSVAIDALAHKLASSSISQRLAERDF